MLNENEHTEFKSPAVDDIYKEVIAFANTEGGIIYIGIDDQGNLTGIANIDETYTRLTNGIRDAIHFEEMRSLEQQLTFNAVATTFECYGVEFSAEKYRTLGIIKNDLYTNLALLLSDQCQHTTKIAVFKDEFCTEFRDSKEFGGSIFQQFENTLNYLTLCNRTVSTIKGIHRTDKQDYPEEAIREALLNALVHRDYSYSGSIIINVNDDKMEFISIGGLLPGLSTEDIRLGISQPRNKNLAEVFHRLRLIESYGTGIRRIYKLYENCPVQPSIEATANAFKIVLPNMNAAESHATNNRNDHTTPVPATITPQMKIVIEYITERGEINDADLQTLLGIKKTRAYLLAKQMEKLGLIETIGRGICKKYKSTGLVHGLLTNRL